MIKRYRKYTFTQSYFICQCEQNEFLFADSLKKSQFFKVGKLIFILKIRVFFGGKIQIFEKLTIVKQNYLNAFLVIFKTTCDHHLSSLAVLHKITMIELALGGTLSWKTGTYLNVLRDIGKEKKNSSKSTAILFLTPTAALIAVKYISYRVSQQV